jgi:hypothetical protein
MDTARLARAFREFGSEAVGADSPLYARVCELAAESPALLELASGSAEGTPMVFLAAVHDELLRDADHALAAYYPSVGGTRAPDEALGAALARFCAAREERLRATLATRRTQTNETARCAALLPAFAAVAGGRPLAQIEIGASAGLNGLWDHYAYDYAGRAVGDPDSPLRIACELRGPGVPPLVPPPVAWRAGIDISPLDVRDPADVRWLRACLWPDQPARHARLEAAVAVAREHGPVHIRRGDALALLPGVIASAPAGALVCVFHTAALAYFTGEQIAGLRELLAGVDRDVAWVGGEAPGLLVADRRTPGAPLHFVLVAGRPGRLVRVGRMGHHGGWLEWLG